MAASDALGILGVDSYHFFVYDHDRSHRFYTERLGWPQVARSSAEMTERTGQRSAVYQSRVGDGLAARDLVRVVVSSPVRDTCRAARYLRRHPGGVGSVTYAVEDLDAAWDFLAQRDGTPIHAIRETRAPEDQGGGTFRHFSVTTAIGDVAFRFVERRGYGGFAPGFEAVTLDAPENAALAPSDFTYGGIDHITSNAPTMIAPKLWMEHVLGMEKVWEIAFHTEDVTKPDGASRVTGTGLKSVVVGDPRSGLKFPFNEPLQPFFKEGQINKFVEDNWGPGVQHIAVAVDDIVAAVRTLRERGVEFLETPGSYYDAAPARLQGKGVDVGHIAHDMDTLRGLGILIDGSPEDRYLVQIFMKDAATTHGDPEAGPFFYELIERRGDPGFGGGNFRALFEAIEREQLDAPAAATNAHADPSADPNTDA